MAGLSPAMTVSGWLFVSCWLSEAGCRKLAAGSWLPEAGCRKLAVKSWLINQPSVTGSLDLFRKLCHKMFNSVKILRATDMLDPGAYRQWFTDACGRHVDLLHDVN